MNKNLKAFLKDIQRTLIRFSLLFVKEKYDSKVFCIGFNKTGTSSMGRSFKLLGLRNSTFNPYVWNKLYRKGNIDAVIKYTAKYDSTDDLPWLLEDMIPLLDKTFPGSKFIYMEREEEAWKKSYYRWRKARFGGEPDPEEAYKGYVKHREFVLDYFKDWPEDRFIILNIKDKKGFKKLADFLGVETDQESFPHLNKS